MSETSAGTVAVLRAKLHDLRVTDADLHYQGSITLDPDHCEAAGCPPAQAPGLSQPSQICQGEAR